MESTDVAVIKGKIVSGVFALTSRTLILQVIALVSKTLLTVILTPAVFGTYYIATAFIDFFNYFSDIGLAAALIQKKEEPTLLDLRTVFTVQQSLIGFLVVLGLIFSSQIGKFYHLDEGGIFLIRALLISFFLSSLKTIPSIILERHLSFNKMILPQVLENLVFNSIVVVLALSHAGVYSFAWAAIARGIVGVIAIYIIQPWKVGLAVSWRELKKLVSYGAPIQANSILALIKDNLMTLFLGSVLTLTQLGYLGWAKSTAELVLRLIMDSVIRVTFPAFSRMQDNFKILGKAIEKSLLFLAVFIFPTTAVLVLFMKPLMIIVPRYAKWENALLAFYLFSFSSVWAAFSTPIVNALNAIGKIKWTLFLMVFWTAITWTLIPLLIPLIGFNAVPVTAATIAATGAIPLFLLKKVLPYQILPSITKPFIITIGVSIPTYFILMMSPSVLMFGTMLVTFGLVYALTTWILMKNEIKPYLVPIMQKVFRIS